MMHKAWSNIEEVAYCFSRSSIKFQGHTGQKNHRFWPGLSVSGLSSLNSRMAMKRCTKLEAAWKSCPIVFSCNQAALRTLLSVCLSVRPSLCHIFFTMFPSSCHLENFRSYYHWPTWCPCKRSRSKVKVTEVMTPFSRFRTVTPVWIHIWRWNVALSLMLLRRGALLFFKVILQISRSHSSKNRRIWPKLGVYGLLTQV